jgi:hypothetical protein
MRRTILLPWMALFCLPGAIGCGGNDTDTFGVGGGGANCQLVSACGGDVSGDWKITGFCPDKSKVPEEIKQICETATLQYDEPKVSGTVAFNSDMSFEQTATASGTGYLVLDAACLKQDQVTLTCNQIEDAINENSGADPVKCSAQGSGCRCALHLNQSPNSSGEFSTSGNTLTLTAGSDSSDIQYCVNGTRLTINLSLSPAKSGSQSY